MADENISMNDMLSTLVVSARRWLEVEGRSRALLLVSLASLPMLAAYAYGHIAYTPEQCAQRGGFISSYSCIRNVAAHYAYPFSWMPLLIWGFIVVAVVGAIFTVLPRNREAALAFIAACCVGAGVAAISLVSFLLTPNGPTIATYNTAHLVVPSAVIIACVIAAYSAVQGQGG